MGLFDAKGSGMENLKHELINKIKVLIETIWESRISEAALTRWLDNFCGNCMEDESEKIHALYLLSHFMYFGNREMRELLKSLFRDLYKYPIIAEIRRGNGNTLDMNYLNSRFKDELNNTRFLGVGNPSESGTHLLYYFRQENALPKTLFIHTHHIFKRYSDRSQIEIRFPNVRRYVFIDDLCGSGSQAIEYSKDIIEDLKRLNPNLHISYYAIFAVKNGISNVRSNTLFDSVESIFELDETFECFNPKSRYFVNAPALIKSYQAENICLLYGKELWESWPLGYKNGQLLLGFYHNVPDNTLPIIWNDNKMPGKRWVPIFRRYPKIYS
jgi:hypothetical protein